MYAVIFDMDGLMFDTQRVFIDAWDYAGEKCGIGKAGYMLHKTLGMSLTASLPIWQAEFGERYHLEKLKAFSKEFIKRYYEENHVPVKDGLYELLSYLHKEDVPMAVASSSPGWEVEHHLREAGVESCFCAVVSGDSVQHTKPDPEIYMTACRLLEKEPSECYALEDSKSGLLSAFRAGCRPIMVPDLWQPDEETRNIVLEKLTDLHAVKAYFERLPFTR